VPWRFSDAGPMSASMVLAFRRPKTCTKPAFVFVARVSAHAMCGRLRVGAGEVIQ
jgi:hypothetical protein